MVLACVAGALPVVSGCGSAHETESAAERAPQPLPVPSFGRKWATELELRGADEVTELHLADDLLLAYTKTGKSYVMKRENGDIQHIDAVEGGAARMRPPVVLKDFIVYPTTSTLVVFDRKGSHLRTIDEAAPIRADVVGVRSSIFVTVDLPRLGPRIRRIDLTQKYIVPTWELAPFTGGMPSGPAIHTDVLYAATDTGIVYALSTETREPIWPLPGNTFDAGAGVVADLKADDAGLFVPTLGSGRLYCLNRISGQVKWQWFGSGELTVSPIVTSDSVYQMDPNQGMVAINKNEDLNLKVPQYNRTVGHGVRWSRTDVTQILAQDEEHTYALRKDGIILALDKKTGDTLFTSRRKEFSTFATNTKDGTIYASTRAGRVLGIQANYLPGKVGELVMTDVKTGERQTVAMVPVR